MKKKISYALMISAGDGKVLIAAEDGHVVLSEDPSWILNPYDKILTTRSDLKDNVLLIRPKAVKFDADSLSPKEILTGAVVKGPLKIGDIGIDFDFWEVKNEGVELYKTGILPELVKKHDN